VTAGFTLPVYHDQLAPVPGFAETVCEIDCGCCRGGICGYYLACICVDHCNVYVVTFYV